MKSKGSNKELSHKDYQLIEVIILHYVKVITTAERTISEAYIANYNQCIDFLSSNHLYRIKPINEINEYISQLGKYNQTPENMRYCLYFSTSMVRIYSEYLDELYDCFYALCFETQKEIKYEIAYDLRFIIKETDIGYTKTKLYPILKTYLCENDLILKEIIIESLFDNIGICDLSIQSAINASISEMLSCNDSYVLSNDFSHFINIFILLVKCYHRCIVSNTSIDRIDCQGVIIKFLNQFLLVNDSNRLDNIDSHNDSFGSDKDNSISYPIDYLFGIFDLIGKCMIHSNNTSFYNNCFIKLLNLLNSQNEALFFSNISHIIKYIGRDILDSARLTSLFNFLQKDIENIESNNSNSSIGFYDGFNYSTFRDVIKIMKDNDNEVFFSKLFGNMNHLEKVCDGLSDDWRSQWNIFASFTDDVLFYFVEKNKNHYQMNWMNKLVVICQKYISADNLSHMLLMEVTKLIARLLKYSNSRNEIIDFINKQVFFNSSFYKRRLGIAFIKECYRVMSYELFSEMKIGEGLLRYIGDKVSLLQISAIVFVNDNYFSRVWLEDFYKKANEIYQSKSIDVYETHLWKVCYI